MTKKELREYCINPRYKVGDAPRYNHDIKLKNKILDKILTRFSENEFLTPDFVDEFKDWYNSYMNINHSLY